MKQQTNNTVKETRDLTWFGPAYIHKSNNFTLDKRDYNIRVSGPLNFIQKFSPTIPIMYIPNSLKCLSQNLPLSLFPDNLSFSPSPNPDSATQPDRKTPCSGTTSDGCSQTQVP